MTHHRPPLRERDPTIMFSANSMNNLLSFNYYLLFINFINFIIVTKLLMISHDNYTSYVKTKTRPYCYDVISVFPSMISLRLFDTHPATETHSDMEFISISKLDVT